MLQLGSKPPELSAHVTFHSLSSSLSNLPCHGYYKSQIQTLHACAQLEREKRSVNTMGFLASAAEFEKSQQLTVQFIYCACTSDLL